MVANLNIKDVGASDHVRFLQPITEETGNL